MLLTIRKHTLASICSLLSILCSGQLPEFKTFVYDSSQVSGYYFLREAGHLMILDKYGALLYYKKTETPGFDFNLWPNGIMTYPDRDKIIVMDSTFREIDSVACKNYETDMHEFRRLNNGHFLLLGTETFPLDLSTYFWKGKYGKPHAIVQSAVIQEQDTNRNVVFEWRAKDHFKFDEADTFYLKATDTIDWTHVNAIEPDKDGNILVSFRNFNETAKINRLDGAIMWKLGGKYNQFRFTNYSSPIYGQHDVRRLPDGHITLFEGGGHPPKHGARALEFKLDEIQKVATLVWSYTYDSVMYSDRRGGVQRLANQNTVINYGFISSNEVIFVVVNPKGRKIFEMDGEEAYRVSNYPSIPWQLHRPKITCFDSVGARYLDAGPGYLSYTWNTGDSSRIIPVSKPGNYYVFIPCGEGGYISSENLPVTDRTTSCTGSSTLSKKSVPKSKRR